MTRSGWFWRGREVTLLVVALEAAAGALVGAGAAWWASGFSWWLAVPAFLAASMVTLVLVAEVVMHLWPQVQVRERPRRR